MSRDAKEREADTAPPDMNLTPMIDVVFLLIIFFVLVTTIAESEYEAVQLPDATEQVLDKDAPRRRLILNVTRGGDIKWRRQTLSETALHRLIRVEAAIVPDPTDPHHIRSNLNVLIRGDVDSEYRHVRRIMQACAVHGVWKLDLATVQPQIARR